MTNFAIEGSNRSQAKGGALTNQIHVLWAIMLHDIKSRYFGTGLGYILMILWPLVHVCVILVIQSTILRADQHGDSPLLFAATAAIPFITANYIPRFMVLSAVANKSFLSYPIIKPFDVLAGRAVLEIVNMCIGTTLVIVTIIALNVNCMPANLNQAVLCLLTCFYLGIAMGFLNGFIAMIWPMWTLVFVLYMIGTYITCGLQRISADELPDPYAYYLSFNPLMQCVSWMRESFYIDYHSHYLNKTYVLTVASVVLTLALIIQRAFRGLLLR